MAKIEKKITKAIGVKKLPLTVYIWRVTRERLTAPQAGRLFTLDYMGMCRGTGYGFQGLGSLQVSLFSVLKRVTLRTAGLSKNVKALAKSGRLCCTNI